MIRNELAFEVFQFFFILISCSYTTHGRHRNVEDFFCNNFYICYGLIFWISLIKNKKNIERLNFVGFKVLEDKGFRSLVQIEHKNLLTRCALLKELIWIRIIVRANFSGIWFVRVESGNWAVKMKMLAEFDAIKIFVSILFNDYNLFLFFFSVFS